MKTTQEFITEATEVHCGRYSYARAIYTGAMKKLLVTCLTHGDFAVSPNNHISKRSGCPRCAPTMPIDTAEFIRRSMLAHGNRYDYSQTVYVNYETPVTVACKIHGSFIQKPATHYGGGHCPVCARDVAAANLRMPQDEFLSKCTAVHSGKYDYSKVEYKGHAKLIRIVCPIHGEFSQTANAHVGGKGCRRCSQLILKGSAKGRGVDEFISLARSVHGDTYDYSRVEYKNTYSHVCIVCKEHGEFRQRPDVHTGGAGCPACSASRGERLIAGILDELGVSYTREAKFAECKNKLPLPFDFYVPASNLLIEYHGNQHYAPVDFWGGMEKYETRISNDAIKVNWASIAGYRLLIVPYTMPAEEVELLVKGAI